MPVALRTEPLLSRYLSLPALSQQRALDQVVQTLRTDRHFALVQNELLAHARLLEMFGPQLGRPRIDTLNGSKHANMKELRFDANNGVWRVAFAFAPERRAVLLIAGDKAGTSQKRFYRRLIDQADEPFDAHLHALKSSTGGIS